MKTIPHMFLNKLDFAFAATITVGAAYLISALFVVFVPDLAGQSLGVVARIVDTNNYFIGFLKVSLYTFIAAWIFALVYDAFLSRQNRPHIINTEELFYRDF